MSADSAGTEIPHNGYGFQKIKALKGHAGGVFKERLEGSENNIT